MGLFAENMRGVRLGIAAAVLAVALLAGSAQAAGLKVSPARFILHNVEPGRQYDVYEATKLRLTIYNESDAPQTWLLSTHRPSERGKLRLGYLEIPDAAWCWFAEKEVTVAPQSVGHGHLHVKIPADAAYFNQHWICTLAVTGKPGAGGFGLALAVEIAAQIETKSRAEVDRRPHGAAGAKPSVVAFDHLAPGTAANGEFELFNNTDKAVDYAVSPLFAAPDVTKKIYLTHGFEALPASDWLDYPATVTVAPQGSSAVPIEVLIPEGEECAGKAWEEPLLVRPSEGAPVFVRVQLEMDAAP